MIKNYLKTALRNFRRNKTSFVINMLGLSLGMACSILILLWVQDELSIDQYHDNIDRIYRVMENQQYASDNIFTTGATPGILAPALEEEVPGIEHAATYTWSMEILFTRKNSSFKENGRYARPELLDILSIPLVYGDKEKQLVQPYTIFISESLAEKYFGSENPVGKTINLNRDNVHTVSGVFRDIPDESTLQFEYLLPFQDFLNNNSWAQSWGNNGPSTVLTLQPGAAEKAVEEKIKDFVKEKNPNSVVELFLYSYADSYLYGRFDNGKPSGGRIDYVRLFSLIAFFVLFIACINFMNLSTARSAKRAREVGIRKSIGANKRSLTGQFIGESVLISFAALLLSVLLVEAFLPVFNNLTGKSIAIAYSNPVFLLSFIGIALLTGMIAGSYPALYLSSFQAVEVLKGTLKSSKRELLARRGLVVFQFVMSIVLIISTIVIYNQVQYVQNKNLGYDRENLVIFSIEGDLNSQWEVFRQELEAIPGVKKVSRGSHRFLGRNSSTGDLEWPGKDPDTKVLFESVRVDYGLVETLGFEVKEGRAFSRDYGADTARVMLNETGINIMDMDNPVGKTIEFWGEQWEIIGVLSDFNYQHLRNSVAPMFMIIQTGYANVGFIRLQAANITQTISQIEETYKKLNPEYPFDYSFMNERYENLYRSETRVGDLAMYFGIFAVFISCLGLFGLSAFTAEQSTKEIGIRKVLGATVGNLVMLLSKEFSRLVIIAIGIAFPLAWWLMDNWLNDYAYRIEIGYEPFLAAGIGALLIAWVTVSYQSVKAAVRNPVKSLRSE